MVELRVKSRYSGSSSHTFLGYNILLLSTGAFICAFITVLEILALVIFGARPSTLFSASPNVLYHVYKSSLLCFYL